MCYKNEIKTHLVFIYYHLTVLAIWQRHAQGEAAMYNYMYNYSILIQANVLDLIYSLKTNFVTFRNDVPNENRHSSWWKISICESTTKARLSCEISPDNGSWLRAETWLLAMSKHRIKTRFKTRRVLSQTVHTGISEAVCRKVTIFWRPFFVWTAL